jgi:alkylation response protein AidB-like acyl-CoA dehydrogenase
MVGEVNGGHKARGGKASKFGELEYAANAVGVCDAAIEMAMQYAGTRMQNGERIIEQQVVQLKLSGMHMLTEALRSFVMRVAAESDDNTSSHSAHNHFLMNFATDAIQRVCNSNMDIHGGTGIAMMDACADKLVRDAIIWTHIAGDSVQRMKAIRHMIEFQRS